MVCCAVIGFPAVDGVLAVANIPADPGIPILAGGFTYWTRLDTRLSNYRTMAIKLLWNYQNIEYRIGKCKKISTVRELDRI